MKKLLKEGADVNGAQGDGMTALHWAALNGDAELASMLLYAGANVGAKTRIGGYTPLHLAAQVGNASVIAPLVAAGAPVAAATATGATALMQAAHSGSTDSVRILLENGADPNVKETANGQTALMFAAAADRVDVVKLLLARGADLDVTSRVEDFAALTMTNDADQNGVPRPQAPPPPGGKDIPGVTRPFNYNELIGKHGGLAALHFAARQGAMATAEALIKGGANVNQRGAGDQTTPMLVAAINGHFDLVSYLLDNGADPNLASEGGVTPLYAVINVQWQPRSFYPQPRAYLQQKIGYLELMKKLLDKGADPNARTNRNTWFTQYNFDLLRTDDSGASPFWRAAYASDIAAMKMLIEHGADPNVSTMKVAGARQLPGRHARRQRHRSVRPSAAADRRSRHAAARRRRGRRLQRRLRRQRASLRADRHDGRGEVSGRRSRRRRERRRRRRQHRGAQRRVARRQRDDSLPRVEGRRREEGQSPRPDDGRHGQRPRAAHAAVSRDDQAARGTGREEQSQVCFLLGLRGLGLRA